MNIAAIEGCCGINELAYIGDAKSPDRVIHFLAEEYEAREEDEHDKGRFWADPDSVSNLFLFTQATSKKVTKRQREQGYGFRLKKFIEQHKLGEVTVGPERENATVGHDTIITPFVWAPDWDAIKAGKWRQVNVKRVVKRRS